MLWQGIAVGCLIPPNIRWGFCSTALSFSYERKLTSYIGTAVTISRPQRSFACSRIISPSYLLTIIRYNKKDAYRHPSACSSLLSLLKAFFSILETYDRDMPNIWAISRCVLSLPFMSPYRSSIIKRSRSFSTDPIFL